MASALSIDATFPAPVREGAAAPLLRTERLTVRFGGLTALDNVDFEIRRGEIRAIIGPNGAGKSTFFNCLTGVLRPTSGRILFNGENIAGLPPNLISQKGIARSYQITNILPNATTLENVRIAAQSRRHGWSMLRHHSAYRDIIDKAQAVLEPMQPGDVQRTFADIAPAARDLGFVPRTPLDEGVPRFVRWYREYHRV